MINKKKIQELRKISGAGILTCKEALQKAKGNIIKAHDILREKGIIQASQKMNRETKCGVVSYYIDNNKATIIKVTVETDFVEKNQIFLDLVEKIAIIATKKHQYKLNELLNHNIGNSLTISKLIQESINKLGENIVLQEIKRISINKGFIVPYVHNKYRSNIGKIAVLIGLEGEKSDDLYNFGKNLSMHIASLRPLAKCINQLDHKIIEKEKEIFRKTIDRMQIKCPNIKNKIMQGKIKKYLSEVILMEQKFIKDNEKTVQNVITELQNKHKFDLHDYIRLEVI